MALSISTRQQAILIAATALALILAFSAYDLLGADISGPDTVEAGSGLVRLSTTIDEGSTVRWEPITPRDLDFELLAPGGMIFAATCVPSVVEIQLIEVTADGAIVPTYWYKQIGEPGPNPDPDPEPDPDPDPPDPPQPVDELVILIIEDKSERGPDFGEVVVELQLWAETRDDRTTIVFDDGTGNTKLAPYVGSDERPTIVLDVDLDASETIHRGPCPATFDEIIALVNQYTSVGDKDEQADTEQPSAGVEHNLRTANQPPPADGRFVVERVIKNNATGKWTLFDGTIPDVIGEFTVERVVRDTTTDRRFRVDEATGAATVPQPGQGPLIVEVELLK